MNILIIGSNGFLGGKAVAILSKDHKVTATSKQAKGEPSLDMTSKEELASALEKYNPNLVFNCAGLVDVDGAEREKLKAWEANVSGPVYLADACRQRGIKLITVSSDYVFSGDNSPYEEFSESHPKSFYGLTKSIMEKAVTSVNPDTLIIRPSILYGFNSYNQKDKLVDPVLEALRAGKEIIVTDLRPKYPVLLDDLIINAMILIERGEKGIFNFASAQTDRYQMARAVARAFGFSEDLVKKGEPITAFGNKPYNVNLINTRAPYLNFHNFAEGVEIIKQQMRNEKI